MLIHSVQPNMVDSSQLTDVQEIQQRLGALREAEASETWNDTRNEMEQWETGNGGFFFSPLLFIYLFIFVSNVVVSYVCKKNCGLHLTQACIAGARGCGVAADASPPPGH